jgi:hypothetical protein
MAVRLSALCTRRTLLPRNIIILMFLWCRQNITLPGTAPWTIKTADHSYNDRAIQPPMTDNLFVLSHLLEAGINAETRMLLDIRAVSARLIRFDSDSCHRYLVNTNIVYRTMERLKWVHNVTEHSTDRTGNHTIRCKTWGYFCSEDSYSVLLYYYQTMRCHKLI